MKTTMPNVKRVRVVFAKEVRDNLRDKRAMTTALALPLMGPLMLVAMFFTFQEAREKARAPRVPVIGKQHAPELVAHLERSGIVVIDPAEGAAGGAADVEERVRKGELDIAVRIGADFGAALRAGEPAVVEVIADESRTSAQPTIRRVTNTIEGYGQRIGALRLAARGVDPTIMRAVSVDVVDVSAPAAKSALLLGMMPMLLIMACFMGGLYVAIDLTAGERERGSLEPLLLNPITPGELVLAKLAATAVFGALAAAASIIAFAVVVPFLPFEDAGIEVHLEPAVAARYFVLFTPTLLLASAIQLFVGTLSKTTKTAQAALGLIVIIPMAPALLTMLFPAPPTVSRMMVPFLGESILALRILRAESIDPVHWLANAGAVVAAAVVVTLVTTRLFGARMLSSS